MSAVRFVFSHAGAPAVLLPVFGAHAVLSVLCLGDTDRNFQSTRSKSPGFHVLSKASPGSC
jgi:hypothetical protein